MSTSEKDGGNDACPNCGTRVESAISAPGEPFREATQRRCPNCGKVLRREVGGTWTIDETASSACARCVPTDRLHDDAGNELGLRALSPYASDADRRPDTNHE